MKKSELLLLLLLFVSACSRNKQCTPNEIKTICLPVSYLNRQVFNCNYSTDSLLYFRDAENKRRLYIVTINDSIGEIIDTILIEDRLNTEDLFVYSYDTMISFSQTPKCLMTFFHNNGEVISEHEFDNNYPYADLTNGTPRSQNTLYFLNTDDSIARFAKQRNEYYRKVAPIYEYNTVTKEGKSWGKFPLFYQTCFGFEESPYICLRYPSECILSYSCIDSLFIYHHGIKQKQLLCKSMYIDRFPEYDINRMFDMSYYRQFKATSPRYSKLLYNPYTEKLYRIAEHQKSVDKTGKIDRNADFTWSIIVINKDFQIENEYLFHYKQYSPHIIISCPKGLYIFKASINKHDNMIRLALFNL